MRTKTTIKGLAVGSAVVVGIASEAVVGPSRVVRFDEPTAILPEKALHIDLTSPETTAKQIQIEIAPAVHEWRPKDARRFRLLTVKRAQLIASPEEQKEFLRLQDLRRAAVAFESGVDALTEWRRQRFAQELLNLLSKN